MTGKSTKKNAAKKTALEKYQCTWSEFIDAMA